MGVAVFPFDEGKANLLAGPGNIRAAVPTSGRVIKSHRASLGELGNEGTGWRMPSHPPPCPPSPLPLFLLLLLFLHQVVLELSPSLGQEVGWSTNTSTRINAWTNCICMYVSNSRPVHTCCLIHARNMCVYTQVVSMNPQTHTHTQTHRKRSGFVSK